MRTKMVGLLGAAMLVAPTARFVPAPTIHQPTQRVALRLAFRFDSSASLATVGVMLHERIARLRVAAGLGQRELCRLAGLNPTFLSRARVSSHMVPRADLVVAIAHVLGTTADWLVAGHGEAPTDAAVVAAVRAARVRSSSIKAA